MIVLIQVAVVIGRLAIIGAILYLATSTVQRLAIWHVMKVLFQCGLTLAAATMAIAAAAAH